jgi:hypothetical protein
MFIHMHDPTGIIPGWWSPASHSRPTCSSVAGPVRRDERLLDIRPIGLTKRRDDRSGFAPDRPMSRVSWEMNMRPGYGGWCRQLTPSARRLRVMGVLLDWWLFRCSSSSTGAHRTVQLVVRSEAQHKQEHTGRRVGRLFGGPRTSAIRYFGLQLLAAEPAAAATCWRLEAACRQPPGRHRGGRG